MNSKLLIVINVFILFSCSDKRNIDNNDLIELIISDKAAINNIEEGIIKYNLKLDTLTPDEISSRYLFMHYTTLYSKDMTFNEIKNGKKIILYDSLLTGQFNFKYAFEKIGNGVFNAAIEDIITLKERQKDGKIRIITNETTVSKDVLVTTVLKNKG